MTLLKLGLNNVKHNFKSYFSYFVSILFSVFMLFMFYSIYYNKQMEAFSNEKVKVFAVFKAAAIVVIIFSALFIGYANSFFIRNRKKEMAIYSILGMKKKEIGILLFCENMFLGLLAIIVGLPLGILSSKFLLQLLVNIMKSNVVVQYRIESRAVIVTIIIFFALFLINSIKAYRVIYKFRLIELLSAGKEADKAPEGSKFLSITSIVMILCGYGIAPKTLQGGSKTIYFGLLVLILVVTGTYILFNNLIIILLKAFKKNKKSYYIGENLISISQILYRIKANSNILATIAVISAVAITAISFTFTTYMVLEAIPSSSSPFSIMYKGGDENLNSKVEQIINKQSEVKVTYKTDIEMINGKALTPNYKGAYGRDLDAPFSVYIISQSEYNKILKNSTLKKEAINIVNDFKFTNNNQCFFIEVTEDSSKRGRLKGDKVNVNIHGNSFDLDIIDSHVNCVLGSNFLRTTLVVPDDAFDKLFKDNKEDITIIRGYNLDKPMESERIVSELSHIIPKNMVFNSFYSAYHNIYALMGSYVFIGLFLGILFVLSTGSILYYKQLTEAYADKERYTILRKIGANKKETKHMVSKQLALIFGLPLLIGLFHSAAALSVYVKFFGGSMYLIKCMLAMIAVYVGIYICYYILSVKSYIKIISSNN